MIAGSHDVQSAVDEVRARIADAASRCGRPQGNITLVGVTKNVPVDRIRHAVAAGLRVLGENRVQEAEKKIPNVHAPSVDWHFIGHLQSNKARAALKLFTVIQSVDSLKLAAIVDRLAAESRTKARVLLEVNTSGEASKHGFTSDQLRGDFEQVLQLTHLSIEGLMTIGPLTADPRRVKQAFAGLRELRNSLRDAVPGLTLDTLSMGMTDDFELAIEEGSTMVRVGRAIFGTRPK